jgi:glutamyl-tRNA(Gln) amidotransferase subunit E
MSEKTDYSKIGLKCGIEIHQQLDTEHKLFCNCRSSFSQEKPIATLIRKLRPVAGEMGLVDQAALEELLKGKEFHYQVYPEETCLVESDEEPPHDLNPDALNISLTISQMLNCEIPEEIHTMRKIVIDGSNTAGFQRTAIVGLDGWVQTSFGKVGITNVCVEEESAQILGKEEGKTVFGLDRLGIPLVEIGTSPDIKTPEQAKEVAEKLGMILRSTGKVKRGLGTIRQDINVSIKGGARVEIKGAQELKMIPKLVEYEVKRQMNLLEIRRDLRKIKFKPVKPDVVNASHIFRDSKSRITQGKTAYAIMIPNFAGFLKRNLTSTRTLGNEIANYVRVKSDLKGIIHSDEDLDKYQLGSEFEYLRKFMKAKKDDMLIIAVGEEGSVKNAMKVVADRINLLADQIPGETRRALEDGNTEYMRTIPGASRMYPETDIPPIKIDGKMLKGIKKNLPELIEDKIPRFVEKYGLSEEISKQIVRSKEAELFEKIVEMGIEPGFIARTLTSTVKELKRGENIPVENLSEQHYVSVFAALKSGKISKGSVPDLLKELAKSPEINVEDLIKKSGIKTISVQELESIVKKTLQEEKGLLKDPRAEKILMGLIMQKVRGRIDGKIVMDVLRREIKRKS